MLFRTIKQKFLGMSAALMLTLTLVFVVVYFLLNPVGNNWQYYKVEVAQRHMALLSMERALSSRNVSQYYNAVQSGNTDLARTEFKSLLSKFDRGIQKYETLGHMTSAESQHITQLKRVVSQALGLMVPDNASGISGFFKDSNNILTQLGQDNQNVMLSTEAKIDQELRNVLTYLAIFLLAAVLLGTFVFLLVSRMITVPLAEMQHIMQRISGENDLTIRMPVHRHDEIGDTSEALNSMLDRFRMLIRQVLGSSHRLLGEVDTMASVSLQTRNSMENQRSDTEMVAASMNEMTATVKTVAENADSAANAASEAQSEAKEGKQVVDQTIGSINKLATEVQRAADVIHRLEEDSENIGVVVDVIRDIAEQTNLLALNAAIEAARAGEQGRGFAVVADEVRTLASRTQESTQEIQQMIERLQAAAVEAVGVMGDGKREAESSVEQAAQAGESLQVIINSVSTIVDMNNLIASAASQQNTTAEEMNRNLAHISEMATDTAEGAMKTAGASEKTVRQVEGLRLIAAQFRAGESVMDLSSYKAGHLAWKARLRNFLDNKYDVPENQLMDHTECELGKWVQAEGMQRCAHYQGMEEMNRIHAELHEKIRNVVTHKHAGSAEDAEAEYMEVQEYADELGGLLDSLEMQADREAGH